MYMYMYSSINLQCMEILNLTTAWKNRDCREDEHSQITASSPKTCVLVIISRYFFSISIHAVFSAASHKCYKVITMIVIKENYCLCKINKYYNGN